MKKLLFAAGLLAVVIGMASCKKISGKGDVVTETRNVGSFSGISLNMDGDVFFTPDTVYNCRVQAQENVLEVIETSISGGILSLYIKDHYTLGKHDQITFWISGPGVTSLNISGSGDIFVEAPWWGPLLKMTVSGSGNVSAGEVAGQELDVSISGSGNVNMLSVAAGTLGAKISGSGNTVASGGISDFEKLVISGSGNIDFREVMADSTVATISGSGDIYTWVTKYLDATISGSGNIYYRGNPVIDSRVSGSGSLIPM
jgi:hypothetical protein